MNKTQKNVVKVAKGAYKVAKVVAKPVIKFGKYLKKVNKGVNAAYKYGARP